MSGNLDMQGNTIEGLPTPTQPTHPVRLKDLGEGELATTAVQVSIEDAGDKYTSSNVEGALQELGTAAFRDVGTAAHEVPTNADLGSAAYEDSDAFASRIASPTPGNLISQTAGGDIRDSGVSPGRLGVRKMELIAHRGFRSQAPQNTMLAMTTALDRGADSLECDVQVSADGTMYLFHDTTVDSLTDGTGTFTSLTDAYIESLAFDSTAGTMFADEKIPTFERFLAFAKKAGVYIYPEIKAYRTSADIELMVQAVVDAGMEDLCMFQSFTFQDLTDVRSLNDTVAVGFLGSATSSYQTYIDNVAALGGGALLWSYSSLLTTPAIVTDCYDAGVGVGAWTVNDTHTANKLMAIGVNRIMSDITLRASR